jgi:hypothetical protein
MALVYICYILKAIAIRICITFTMLIESLCSTDMLSTDNPGLTNDVLLRNIGTTRINGYKGGGNDAGMDSFSI